MVRREGSLGRNGGGKEGRRKEGMGMKGKTGKLRNSALVVGG